ncbi:hypothetical protein GCM10023203_41500 [Actinomycetospora straminea]|uniref:Bacteriocin resistance YdeI/OmpD-like protein n=1 Tax=Actinomycetospora straminea TaxID=663607 RepID=A0ABP9EQI2_9PSEU
MVQPPPAGQRLGAVEQAARRAPGGGGADRAGRAGDDRRGEGRRQLDDVEDLVVPPDLAAAFDAHPGAREQWDGFSRSKRRAMLVWLVEAKRPATRAGRIAQIAERAAAGEVAFPRA